MCCVRRYAVSPLPAVPSTHLWHTASLHRLYPACCGGHRERRRSQGTGLAGTEGHIMRKHSPKRQPSGGAQSRRIRTKQTLKLPDSENLYRDIFENANDAIALFSLDGIITTVNRGAERLLGWSREELIGQHIRKVATSA